jgi:hypothetical protein
MYTFDPDRLKVGIAKLSGDHSYSMLQASDVVQVIGEEALREIVRHAKAQDGDPKSPFNGVFELHIEVIPLKEIETDG